MRSDGRLIQIKNVFDEVILLKLWQISGLSWNNAIELESDIGEDGQLILVESTKYEYKFVEEGHQFVSAYVNDILTYAHVNKASGTIDTGLYCGDLRLGVIALNHDCTQEGEEDEVASICFEVRSKKMDYREHYRYMLDDIVNYYLALVLSQNAPVHQKMEIDHNTDANTLYQRYVFLKSIIEGESFMASIYKIIASPVRKWTDTIIEQNIWQTKRLNRNTVRQIASGKDRIPIPNGRKISGLSSLPKTVQVRHKRDTIDHADNQFVKHVLTTFKLFCVDLYTHSNASARLKSEVKKTMQGLENALENIFFKQVSSPTHINLNSPVLQRREGYRYILQMWVFFDLGAKLSWKGGDDVYEAGKRNIAVLYEYWVFFNLLEAVQKTFDVDFIDKRQLVELSPDCINLRLRQGKNIAIPGHKRFKYTINGHFVTRKLNFCLYYNRTFSCNTEHTKAGSWTAQMRPDYTLSVWPGEIKEDEAECIGLLIHIHFDAKYRVDRFYQFSNIKDARPEDFEQREEESEWDQIVEDEEVGRYRRADLLKMHAYKDAIRRSSGAYLIYPGTDSKELKQFEEIIPGLGAFCLIPSKNGGGIKELEKFLNKLIEHSLNVFSQREHLAYYTHKIYQRQDKDISIGEINLLEEFTNEKPENNILCIFCSIDKLEEEISWMRDKHLCAIRAKHQGVGLSLTSEVLNACYLLLLGTDVRGDETIICDENCHLFKLKSSYPSISTRHELHAQGFPKTFKEDVQTIYYLFELDDEILYEEEISFEDILKTLIARPMDEFYRVAIWSRSELHFLD